MRYCLPYLLLLLVFATACGQKSARQKSPAGYNLTKPEKFNMPESLLEISGICFNGGNSDTVYAIQDEDGKVFKLAYGNKKQVHTKFDGSGDYEDLAILHGRFWVLQSNGTLYSFPMKNAIEEEADDVRHWKKFLPDGEYETLFGDEQSGRLYTLCKDCDADKNHYSSGYIITLQQGKPMLQSFKINVDAINALAKKDIVHFRPSGMAKNPITGQWYIISAVNKLLVVLDANWDVLEVYHLSQNRFNQPEGIAFDQQGNLYISNEGDDFAAGNILKFVRK